MSAINQKQQFKPSLGLLDATMLVAGSMIGSGIFIVSAEISYSLGSAGWLTAMWVLAGLVTIIAAMSYGELSGMYPKAGGQYVYLREAYNPFIAFLFGWTQFGVIQTGTIAAVAMAFAKYTDYVFPVLGESRVVLPLGFIDITMGQIVAIASVVLLTYINTKGVKHGKILQTVFTLAKLLSLFGLIIFGFLLGAKAEIWNANWANAWTPAHLTKDSAGNILSTGLSGIALLGAIAVSMKGSLFSSDAWNNVTFIAAEIKNPQKNIGRSLFLGTFIVTSVYVLTNLMYLSVLPFNDIAFAPNERVGVAAAEAIFGAAGSIAIAVMIMVSTFGCNNGLILSGARMYYTMAEDGVFIRKAAILNKNDVPANGLWLQCLWASILCLSGSYNKLLALVIFGVLLFYVLTIIGIFRLRKTQPDVPRPYKAFGYPVLPAIYVAVASGLALLLLYTETTYALFGLGIILIGIPIYYLARSANKKTV